MCRHDVKGVTAKQPEVFKLNEKHVRNFIPEIVAFVKSRNEMFCGKKKAALKAKVCLHEKAPECLV